MGSLFLFWVPLTMYHTKHFTVDEALKKMERYCAYQERCHKDITDKLKGMRMIPEARAHIIAHLIQENYLNEERFAKSFTRGKFNIKKWGKNRIVLELRRRDISAYNIKSALTEINENEYLDTLDTLAQKRVAQLRETNVFKKRRKLADYLLYRGWEPDLVYAKTKELIP